jgi:hypothetical protein
MFRARIFAQAFTLVAMVAGSIYWDADRKKRKEFEGAVAERKAKEKNAAWIRELEARDEEEKEIRAMRERRRAGRDNVIEKVKTKLPEGKEAGERFEEAIEKAEEKGKGILDRVFGGGEPKPPKGANSMIEESERRKPGVLELVQELVFKGKK